jgi:hypothetical protein
MITNSAEQELRDLERRLETLQQSHPAGSKGFTKAGIRKMIARIHEELALYGGSDRWLHKDEQHSGHLNRPPRGAILHDRGTAMVAVHPQHVVDENQQRKAVLVPLAE